MQHTDKNSQPPLRTVQRGFTIVEVLVALVVLAVGMLGIAGLFVMTLRSGGNAINRMQAVNLAQDIADRIRANKTAGAAYAGAAANNNCERVVAPVDCTPALLAANDLFMWNNQIASVANGALPGGAGVVAYVAPAAAGLPGTYTITVSWQEQGQSNGIATQTSQALSYTLTMQI